MSNTRQHVHELNDRLPPTQLSVVAGLLEAMLDFRQVVAGMGFTMDQIRNAGKHSAS